MGTRLFSACALVLLASCAHHVSGPAAPRQAAKAPAAPEDADGAVEIENVRPKAEGQRLAAHRWADDAIPDDETALTSFASKKELVKLLEKHGLVEDDPPSTGGVGSMWGDAIGDSFGAGGLGLSGVGEGGGGTGEGIGLGSVGTLHGEHAAAGAAVGNMWGADAVTNVQVAGVDEGGIVKVHGEHLVVLRRGRLFTIELASLKPVAAIDAFGPGIDPQGTWYDEMLVSKDTIAVVGYSYERGGTEIGLFDITKSGQLAARSTYHLRSDDYYSSRNYASRLLGDKLVFYMPGDVYGTRSRPLRFLPALRKWHRGAKEWEFASVLDPTKIDKPLDDSGQGGLTLHSVVMCDLAKRDMTCTARAVLAPPGRVFYVSQDAVYVWTMPFSAPNPEKPVSGTLYRLPLGDSGAIGAVRVRGAPTDSFSFDEDDGTLNVLVRTHAPGDVMWHAEIGSETADVALMRIATSRFARKVHPVPGSAYVSLPAPWSTGVFTNRFVGGTVLYGNGNTWGRPHQANDPRVFTYDVTGANPPTAFDLGHGVDRIEAMGSDAIVVGGDEKDLHFSSIALGNAPKLGGVYTRANAAQGETRSHGFFYRSDGDRKGLFGLPIRGAGEAGWHQLAFDSASVLFVENDGLAFKDVGALEAKTATTSDDACKASCVDWYGNARPLFLRGHVFALLGYEIVEGKITSGKIAETRRASFAPKKSVTVSAR